MHKKTAALRAFLFAPWMAVGLLAGCGGGGGSAPPTLSGTILGLAPNGVLELRVNGQAQSFSTTVYAAQMPLSFSRVFSAGESYAIDVQKHPVGQICAVLRSASGRLDSSVSDVRVECHTTRLNDTGIAGATAAETSALAPDSQAGRDAEVARLTKVGAGARGFDYTKVCTGGRDVDAVGGCPTGETWDCVRDNVTTLMWRRSDVAYAVAAVPAATASLCGRTNWRSPTVHEMLSVVHAGQAAAPFVDADYFSVTPGIFHTSEAHLNGVGTAWVVDLSNAGASGLYTPGGSELRRALWVSGSSALDDPLSSAYTKRDVSSQFVIIDTSRELMWLVPKTVVDGDWAGAVASVATVNAEAPGGYGDWRLPNRSELDALVNRSRKLPAMDPVVSSAIADPTNAVSYWSSSPYVGSPSSAWVVDFSYGDISSKVKTTSARYIYVRNRAFNVAP